MAGLVRKLELSFVREKALRTAGTVLVTATNREEHLRAAMQAARLDAGEGSVVRVLAGEGDRERSLVVAASDGDGGRARRDDLLSILTRGSGTDSVAPSDEVPLGEAELAGPLAIPEGVAPRCSPARCS